MHPWQALWHYLFPTAEDLLIAAYKHGMATGELGTHNPEMITQTRREDGDG